MDKKTGSLAVISLISSLLCLFAGVIFGLFYQPAAASYVDSWPNADYLSQSIPVGEHGVLQFQYSERP